MATIPEIRSNYTILQQQCFSNAAKNWVLSRRWCTINAMVLHKTCRTQNDTQVNWPECRMGWCVTHSYSPVGPHIPSPSCSFYRTQLVSGYTPTHGPALRGRVTRWRGWGKRRLFRPNASPSPLLRGFLPHPSRSPEWILPETKMNARQLFLLPPLPHFFCTVGHVTSHGFKWNHAAGNSLACCHRSGKHLTW